MSSAVQSVVLGAGAAGLAAALELEAMGREVLLIEAADRVGGVMQSVERAGFTFELGPNTTRIGAPTIAFLRRVGLGSALLRAAPASRKRFLLRDEGLVAAPMDPVSLLRSPLLSAAAKRRLLREPFVARGDATGETVADFIARRLGPEIVEALVGPFLVGVYAGDERRLGADAVFPSLTQMERRYGSLVRGALAGLFDRGERGLAGTWSCEGGLGALASRLAARLARPPQLACRARALVRDGDAWSIALEGGTSEEVRAHEVVLALPAPAASALLAGVDAALAEAPAAVAYAPIASVALSVDPAAAKRHPIEGFGFLVPRDQPVDLLGALFMSQLFPGRAPEGRELIQAMIGGLRWPAAVDAPDDVLLERIGAGLDRGLGLASGFEPLHVQRWPHAVAQPDPGHPKRIAELGRRLAALPGLRVAGSWVAGVGLSDTLASGVAAAQALAG